MLQNTDRHGNAHIHLLKGQRDDEFLCCLIGGMAGGNG